MNAKVERFGLHQIIILYRLGWLHGAGKPLHYATSAPR